VTGNRDMADWDSFVAEITGAGLPDIIAVYQSAYDRYNAR